ncbi:armadillo repeat-containing protein 7 [Anthonomus grandis grandis]|uniref:armadillo repeat-containing protein 7 n=1 Tax=Anthonomus grandis grandis TaxID=2921223 RepID=UPI0021669418|nr:armadillo repeat-containing protein 7 [Anthonomus grandis grandis]
MFSRKEQLLQKTGEFGVGRYDFLKQLIHEFATTKSYESKKQTLANLANFCYDPINYEYMKQLHITELFLAQLSENSEDLIHFSLAGICNICCDPEFKQHIISLNGVNLIKQYLMHKNEEISVNALTALFYLFDTPDPLVPADVLSIVNEYEKSSNPRLKNLGKVFLETYSTSPPPRND